MPDLTGFVALITGASRGIGFAIAEHLVRSGARVCLTGRSEDDLRAAVERLGGPEHAIAVAGSSDNLDHQDETIRRLVEQFGVPNILVNSYEE
jgi:NAD(P)-dependent dehydrogenase (short-subunit alcohol dehydrogenase family)